jgi:hypothetical protein
MIFITRRNSVKVNDIIDSGVYTDAYANRFPPGTKGRVLREVTKEDWIKELEESGGTDRNIIMSLLLFRDPIFVEIIFD